MPLAAQVVQSVGDLFLIRVIENPSRDLEYISSGHHESEGIAVSIGLESSSAISSWVTAMANALQEQWPRQETREGVEIGNCEYYRKLIIHHEPSYPSYNLACSYLLIQQEVNGPNGDVTKVLGHARLTECYESAGGNAAAATYILIDPSWRGKGYGKHLLRLLELEAKAEERLGCQYHFIYLWCKATTAPFYEHSGYRHSRNRVSLQRPCLKALTASSVQSLEEILQRRQSPVSEGNNNQCRPRKRVETVVLLPSIPDSKESTVNENEGLDRHQQSVKEGDVWLRKRLVDHVQSILISEKDRINEIKQFALSSVWTASKNIPNTNSLSSSLYRWNSNVPWQMQIGPSCGLTAIRMVCDFYNSNPSSDSSQQIAEVPSKNDPSLSLLHDARRRGYTEDGEIFDANHLRELIEDQLYTTGARSGAMEGTHVNRISVCTRDSTSLTTKEIDFTLQKGGLWIIPYDSNPRTKLPCNMQGKHAHWGILVGTLYSVSNHNDSEKLMNAADQPELVSALLLESGRKPGIGQNLSERSKIFWIVQHSLSSKWAVAPMEDWLDSNQQLISINDDKFTLGQHRSFNLQHQIIQILP